MLVLTHDSPRSPSHERFFRILHEFGSGRRNFPGLVVLGSGFGTYGPISGVAFTADGAAVVGIQEVVDASGYLFAPARGAWTVGGRLIHLAGGGSNPVSDTDVAVKNVVALLRRRGIDPGYMQSLIAVDGDLSGVAQPETERSSGVVVVRSHPEDIVDGITRATTQMTGGLKQLWTSADVLAALKILGYDGSQIPVEALTNEGFPYSPYVLRPTSTDDAPVASVQERPLHRHRGTDEPAAQTMPSPRVAPVPPRPPAPLVHSQSAADSLLDAPADDDRDRSPLRWVAGLAVLAVLVIAVFFGVKWLFSGNSGSSSASGGNSSQSEGAPSGQSGGSSKGSAHQPQTIGSLTFSQGGYDQTAKCATFAYGDIQSLLEQVGCTSLTRGLYLTEVDGKQVVISVADVEMKSANEAQQLKSKVDTDGTGNVNDLLRDGVIPEGYPGSSVMANAEYASSVKGSTVRIIEAAFANGAASTPNVNKAADVALKLKLEK